MKWYTFEIAWFIECGEIVDSDTVRFYEDSEEHARLKADDYAYSVNQYHDWDGYDIHLVKKA